MTLVADPVYGSGVQSRQSTMYPYQATVEIQEDFLSGGSASGSIGTNGWLLGAAGLSQLTSEANRIGIIRLDSTAVSGTIARMFLYASNAGIDPSASFSTTSAIRLNSNDANTTTRIGLMNAVSANPPNEGVYFEKLDADTNWFCVTRAGSVQTRTDSGVAITTAFTTMSVTRSSSGAVFSIGASSGVCTHTANIPTTFITPAYQIINSAAASKTMDVDYFQLSVTVSR